MKGRVSQLHGKMFLLTKNMIQKIYTYHQWGICQSSFHFKNKRVVKRNEEKNNICLMHFGCAFGVIRTKKEMTQCIFRGYTILTEAG